VHRLLIAITVSLTGGTGVSQAFIANPPTAWALYQRVAWSDLIVNGKVAEVERKPARYTTSPTTPVEWYTRTTRIEVSEVLLGPSKIESVRLAVNPMWLDPPKSWSDTRNEPPKGLPRVRALAKGREGIFYLSRHHSGEVYVEAMNPIFTDKDDPAYATELVQCRRLVRLLAEPKKSLQARDPADRLDTAGMLVWRYRVQRYDNQKTEPIDAEESKLILDVLAEVEWNWYPRDPQAVAANRVFEWLAPLEGMKAPAERENFEANFTRAAKEWLRANRERHRIQRYLPHAK
jgi:hypothetical protein